MAKNKQPTSEPATTPAVETAQPKKARFIATRATAYGSRSYAVGEVLELEVEEAAKLNSWPAGFMPMELEGPQGTIQVPIFFCLRECSRHGRTYKAGEIWERFNEPVPEGLFVPWERRDDFEFIDVGGIRRAELHRKASVDQGPPPAPAA